MENGKDTNKSNKNYIAIARYKKRQNILKMGFSIAAAIMVLGVAWGVQASGQGTMGMMEMHIHPQISVSVNGQPTVVPENVGIDQVLWKDHSLDKYGMQGMSPLHTHDSSGTIHVESLVKRDYTLGDFLDVWGGLDTTSGKEIKVTVDGTSSSDWKNHILKDGEQISFEIT